MNRRRSGPGIELALVLMAVALFFLALSHVFAFLADLQRAGVI